MRRQFFIWLHVLIALLIVSASAAPQEAPLRLIADGGSINNEWSLWWADCNDLQEWDFLYGKLQLTVKVENLREAVRIEGVIAHPYGEGPFELTLGNSPFIVASEIVTEGTHVAFAVELAKPAFPHSLTLFTAKPDLCDDRKDAWFRESYPAYMEWIEFKVEDMAGAPIAVSTHTNPVLFWNDGSGLFQVFPQGFSTPIIALFLVELNSRELYSPWKLAGSGDVYGISGWFGNSFYDGIPGLPMVFEVVLEDGQRHRIPVQETTSQVILTPASAAAHWEQY